MDKDTKHGHIEHVSLLINYGDLFGLHASISLLRFGIIIIVSNKTKSKFHESNPASKGNLIFICIYFIYDCKYVRGERREARKY